MKSWICTLYFCRTCLMLWERTERNFLPWPRIKVTEELFFIVFIFFFKLLSFWFWMVLPQFSASYTFLIQSISFYCVRCIIQSSYVFPLPHVGQANIYSNWLVLLLIKKLICIGLKTELWHVFLGPLHFPFSLDQYKICSRPKSFVPHTLQKASKEWQKTATARNVWFSLSFIGLSAHAWLVVNRYHHILIIE